MKSILELTNQEHCVLALVAKGWRNAKIAEELVVSQRTVESHLYHIFDKLNVQTRTEAALVVISGKLSLQAELSENADVSVSKEAYS